MRGDLLEVEVGSSDEVFVDSEVIGRVVRVVEDFRSQQEDFTGTPLAVLSKLFSSKPSSQYKSGPWTKRSLGLISPSEFVWQTKAKQGSKNSQK